MSTPRARTLGILLLLSVGLAAVLLGRAAGGAEAAVDALRPAPGTEPVGQAFKDGEAAAPAPPAKPRREIVPNVEVVVNIPSGRLELREGGEVVKSYPVSVGSARYATPVGDYLLATVIWNPWWHPPPESGWARNRKPEPPGPRNPMGRVKLHMDELIYIHGTTSEGRLGAPASHGCIRMSNADVVDLARRLHRIAAPEVTDARLDALSAVAKEERRTLMARSIRMRVTYQVARVKGDRLHVYPDVYGKAGGSFAAQVRRELARGGVDTAQVGAAAMSRLRSSAGARGGASFALADVPSLRPLPPAPKRESGPALLGRPVDATLAIPADLPTAPDTAAPAPPPAPVAETAAAPGESPANPR